MKLKFYPFFLILMLCFTTPAMSSIIRRPPVKTADITYKDLVCTDEHRACIHELISTMGEQGKLSLLFKQSHLKNLGERISDVHPLKFLAVILTDPYLKSCMPIIWNDYFKRTNFIEGLGNSLSREMDKGKLLDHLNDFAAEVGFSPESLRGYFDARDWENFVRFMIYS